MTATASLMTATPNTANNRRAMPPATDSNQLKRMRESLAFLGRFERIHVTGTTFFDQHERVQFDVRMKDSTHLSARAARRAAKKKQPVVDYSTKKSLTTLKSVHKAVHEWSAKHADAPARDGSSQCPYCKQFNSAAALQLWKWRVHHEQQREPTTTAGLAVVADTRVLEQFEQCLNSYVECARSVPAHLLDAPCPGVVHIPAIVASFVANEPTMPSGVAYTILWGCSVM